MDDPYHDYLGDPVGDFLAERIRANNGGAGDDDENAHLFGRQLVPAHEPVGGSWDVPFTVVHPRAIQQAMLHAPAAQQPVAEQLVAQYQPQPQLHHQHRHQQPVVQLQQPVVQQQAAQQPAPPEPAVQQSGPNIRSCPVQGCDQLEDNKRLDHLWDHLAEKHGYEKAANEYTVDDKHIGRKNVPVLKLLLIRDARKLAWSKARLQAAVEAIMRADRSYVGRHGLNLSMGHSIREVAAYSKKAPLKAKLTAVRNEMSQKGRLHHQTGPAQSSWDQVFEDLVSTFQLDRRSVVQRAEQCLHHLRVAMGDNMADNVTPASVELTHQLPLKAGAALPPK